MKYALVIVENHPNKNEQTNALAFRNILNRAKDSQPKIEGLEILNDSAFLCSLNNGLSSLCKLIASAEEAEHQTRVLFFDQEPSWIITNSKNKKIQEYCEPEPYPDH